MLVQTLPVHRTDGGGRAVMWSNEIQMPEIRRSDRSRTAQEAGSGEAKCNNAGGYGEYFDTHEMIGITLIERRGIPFSSSDEGRTKAERHGPGCRNAVAKYTSPSYAGAVEGVSGVSVVKGQYVPLRHVRVSGVSTSMQHREASIDACALFFKYAGGERGRMQGRGCLDTRIRRHRG